MKTSNTGFKTLEKVQLENLVQETRETIAVIPVHTGSFSIVDLWNVERSKRTRIARRHFA